MTDERLRIPDKYRAVCYFNDCGEPLNVRAPGVYQWTSGWVANREGGGGHGITLPERTLRWACARCIADRVAGKADQLGLPLT